MENLLNEISGRGHQAVFRIYLEYPSKGHPIGGEIRPEAWGKVFDPDPGDDRIQNFRKCVDQTHASWLMDTGMFEKKAGKERKQRAEGEVRRMGYEFYVPSINLATQNNKLRLQNRGVAPFYYDWRSRYGMIANGEVWKSKFSTGKLKGLLPGDPPRVWNDMLDTSDLPKGKYTLAFRIANSLPNGLPLRFTNATQDRDLDGWMSIANVER